MQKFGFVPGKVMQAAKAQIAGNKAVMNPLKSLQDHGQAVWLDFLSRGFIANGELKKLVDDGWRARRHLEPFDLRAGDRPFRRIRRRHRAHAAGARPARRRTLRSISRSRTSSTRPTCCAPPSMRRTAPTALSASRSRPISRPTRKRTIAEAKRLWRDVDRKNLMIKVPATPEGLPAIHDLIADGINVNITLLFAQQVYEQVVEAYLSGLEALARKGRRRVEDRQRRELLRQPHRHRGRQIARREDRASQRPRREGAPRCAQGQGRDRQRQARLPALQAAVRRRALGSSGGEGRKDAAPALGQHRHQEQGLQRRALCRRADRRTTPSTPCRSRPSMHSATTASCATASRRMSPARSACWAISAAPAFRSMPSPTKLVEDGVRLFADAADKLLGAVAKKRVTLLREQDRHADACARRGSREAAEQAGEDWRAHGNVRRLWQHDKSLWTSADEDQWLGWLDASTDESDRAATRNSRRRSSAKASRTRCCSAWADRASALKCWRRRSATNAAGRSLRILDSTDPAQIRAIEATLDLAKTLFIVSSKSGSTTEPNILKDYFYKRVADAVGKDKAGRHFIAITDPGSSLEKTAKAEGFRHIFHGVPSIGGRYSVLSAFGLVPAAAAGIDVAQLVASARDDDALVRPRCAAVGKSRRAAWHRAWRRCARWPRQGDDPGLARPRRFRRVGRAAVRRVDRQKRQGPDSGRRRTARRRRRSTATIASSSTCGSTARRAAHEAKLAALEKAGHPVVRIVLKSAEHIGQEFFRFEIATAVAGAIIGINPFDQPDVEASKVKTRELTAAFEKIRRAAARERRCGRDKAVDALHRRRERQGAAQRRCRWRRRKLAQGAFFAHPQRRLRRRAGLRGAR